MCLGKFGLLLGFEPKISDLRMMTTTLTKMAVAQSKMAAFCFDVLWDELNGTHKTTSVPEFTDDPYPLFVTWNIFDKRYNDYILRGCIGTFTAQPLHSTLREYAITSAMKDRRFKPISLVEVERLQCGVSLLTNFEKRDSYLDWQVGTHGIWIEFELENGRTTTATYLPEVASEQGVYTSEGCIPSLDATVNAGWDHLQAIDSLLKKGGYRAHITEDLRQSIRLTRYQSEKVKLNFADWKSGNF
eukprot:TRINITY_DN7678_c0_g1_i1.p1 TRINITY_DN7678_c0_g1~~TRINITY_DN7678_c0_g1_i1.p1  ORF type:complete len:244 (+),score=20.70 TRINITY_DN7678_c0_g1_i1:88-819(+)